MPPIVLTDCRGFSFARAIMKCRSTLRTNDGALVRSSAQDFFSPFVFIFSPKVKEKLLTNELDLSEESGNVRLEHSTKGDNEMDELDSMELGSHEIACMALATLGVMVEDYCEQGYCDPVMYKALELAERLAKKLGEDALATRLATAKMYAGETVNEVIERNSLDVEKW